jgi:hypothetical protein
MQTSRLGLETAAKARQCIAPLQHVAIVDCSSPVAVAMVRAGHDYFDERSEGKSTLQGSPHLHRWAALMRSSPLTTPMLQ